MTNPLKNLSFAVPLLGPGLHGRGNNVRPARDNADTPRRHPLFRVIPEVFSAIVRPNRGRNAGNHDGTATVATAARRVANPPHVLPQLQFVVDGSGTAPERTATINNTNNTPLNVPTHPVTVSTTPVTSNRPSPFAPRRNIGKSQLNELLANKYRRYQPDVDTLNPNDPRPEAFKKLTSLEQFIFFRKLPADRQATLLSKLTRDEQIEFATAPHMAILESLLKDNDILTKSQDLAVEHYWEDYNNLVKAIHRKIIHKPTVPAGDFLTDDDQVKFLKQLHVVAPNCQAQGRWGPVRPNAKEALERMPGSAKDDLYMVALQTPTPANSRLILTVALKDVISVAQKILNLAEEGDASIANTKSMKIMGPNRQGRRYDSIVVNFGGFDRDGANALAAKLHSALPNVKWLKGSLMLDDEISDGCGYGETREENSSFAEEHAKILADALVEIAGDPRLPHDQVLRGKIDEHQRSLLNPALIRRAEE